MESSNQLANRVREVFLDGTWIANTNYNKALSGLSMEQACRSLNDLNSIAALTYHVNYYLSGVLKVLEGGPLEISDQYSFNLPPVTSEADWVSIRSELLENADRFANRVQQLQHEKLESDFANPKYGNYRRNIEGLIEHSYYHLGQISLIRKMM